MKCFLRNLEKIYAMQYTYYYLAKKCELCSTERVLFTLEKGIQGSALVNKTFANNIIQQKPDGLKLYPISIQVVYTAPGLQTNFVSDFQNLGLGFSVLSSQFFYQLNLLQKFLTCGTLKFLSTL